MVAIVTGSGLGLAGSSVAVLGGGGQYGNGAIGQSGEQAYVNGATGNLVLHRQDEFLVGRGPDIGIVRTYNSQAGFDFDNNDGWQLSLYRGLAGLSGTINTAGSSIKRIGADGSQLTYTYDSGRGLYVNRDGGGAYDTLAYRDSDGTWRWTDGDSGTVESYEAAPTAGQWRITGQADRDGNSLSYGYDANGLITTVTDANGEATHLTYDSASRQLQSIQVVADGLTTTRIRYTYDSQGRLTAVTTDLTPKDGSIADGKTYTTTYTYDGTSTRIASITQGDGTRVSFTYDNQQRIQTITDGLGQTTTLTYAGNSTTITDPLGQHSTLTYDGDGNLLRMQGPDGSGQDIRYSYNNNGDLVALTDSRGQTITSSYDANGNLLRQQDSGGNVVERAYNEANQLVRETRYLRPDPDGNGPIQAEGAQTTYYVRDGKQHLRFTISAEGRVSEYRYNAQGQQTSSLIYGDGIYPSGGSGLGEADLEAWVLSQNFGQIQRTDMAYDARGLVTRLTRYSRTDGSGNGIADGSQVVVQYVYDSTGHLLQQIDPRGNGNGTDYLTSYAYDGLGRTLSITQYDGSGLEARQTLTTYNDAENRIEVMLANGLRRVSTYDARGLLLSQAELDGNSLRSLQSYQYDAAGRLVVVTDPNGNRSYTVYDAAGRKVGSIDGAGALTEFVYNANGQVIKTLRYATRVSAELNGLFAPDAQGVVPTIDLAVVRPTTSTADPVERRIYDVSGRLRFSIDAQGYVTERQYDGTGRLLSVRAYANPLSNVAGLESLAREALPDDIQLLSDTPTASQVGLKLDPANDRISRYFYDQDGLLVATLDGEGYLTRQFYDGMGRQVQTTRYATRVADTHRLNGDLATLLGDIDENGADNVSSRTWYNGLGQIVGNLDGAGYYTAYQYDAAGNRTRSTRYATPLSGETATTVRPQIVSTAPGVMPAGGYILANSQDRVTQATWNAFNQLESETTAEGTLILYRYDSAGNRLQTITTAGSGDTRSQAYRYDIQGRLIQELSAAGAQALAALGDAPEAAQVEAIWTTYGTTYRYDAAGRKTQRVDANGNVTLYFYDADDRLTFTVARVRDPADPTQWVGEVSARQFNALGQLSAEIRYATRIPFGAMAALSGGDQAQIQSVLVADPTRDARTDYRYQLAGALESSTVRLNDGQQAITTLIRNAFGEVVARQSDLTAGRVRREEFTYDRRGLLLQHHQDVPWSGNPNAAGVVLSTTYDAFGRVASKTDGNGNVQTFAYDKLGRQIQSTVAAGRLNLSHHTAYDAFDRILTQIDALGRATTYRYVTAPDTGMTTVTMTTPEGIVTRTVTDRYGQTVVLVDGLGNELRYTHDADGNLTAIRRWERASGAETLLETDSYDAVGNRLSVSDANGTVTTYAYDAANRLIRRQVDPTGLNLTTTYAYDAKGQQINVTNANGVVTRTSYDLAGRVIETAIDPTGLNLRTRYVYDLAGNRVTLVEGDGTPEARTTQYDYDSLNRRIRTVIDPNGLNLSTTYAYDSNGNLAAQTEAAGTEIARTTRYSYDEANRLIYTTDALGGVVKNDYDAQGRLIQRTAYASAISLSSLAVIASVADIGARVHGDVARDRVTRHLYDQDGRERFTIDAMGAVTEARYDNVGNVVQRIAYANPLQGDLAAGQFPSISEDPPQSGPYLLASSNDRVSSYSYDAAHNLLKRTDAPGSTLARTESWGYDAAGNVIRHSDARGNQEWFAYDAAHRQVRHIDREGYVTETRWLADGRKQAEIRYATAVVRTSSDDRWAYEGHAAAPVINNDPLSGDRHIGYTYDSAGRLLTRSSASGVMTRYGYDALGNTVDITVADGTSLAATTHRAYDSAGRLITETRAYGTADAAKTLYTYDAQGNQRGITEAADSAAVRLTRQEFDLLGRKTAAIDGNAARTETTYNTFGDIVAIRDPLGNTGYFYTDGKGRVTLQVNPEGAVTETRYDLLGNQTETIRYANRVVGSLSVAVRPQILAGFGSGPYVVLNDAADQRQQVLYDGLGRKTEIRTWWGPSGADYYRETFAYDASDNVITVSARNGAMTTYRYDALGRKIEEAQPAYLSMGTYPRVTLRQLVYNLTYDAFGNLVGKSNVVAAGAWGTSVCYVFDKEDRQVREMGTEITVFDPVTQLEAKVTPTRQKIYDVQGRLIEEVDALGGRTLHYYDSLGHETGRVDANGTYTAWTYDAAGNRIRQTTYANTVQPTAGALTNTTAPAVVNTVPGSGVYVLQDANSDRTVHYRYDGVGRQIETRIDGIAQGVYRPEIGGGQYQVSTADITTGAVYDVLGNLIKRIDGNGNVTRLYYDRSGQKLGELDAKGYLTVWIRDAAGNVVQETKYARACGISVNDGTLLTDITAAIAPGADDRTTLYTYDKLNRVLSETRKNVAAGSVDSSSGALNEYVGDAVTRYEYDGFNNVTRKIDSQGAQTDWRYDGLGRVTREQKAGYVDAQGRTVRPTIDTEYNLDGQVLKKFERGTDDTTISDDRTTYYSYNACGFLIYMADAGGNQTDYKVDANGNVTQKTLRNRVKADGSRGDDVTLYQYDGLNRQIKSTDVGTGSTQEVRYNAFGEITGKRSNGGGAQVVWQEFAEYDQAGRAWKSNSGDGITQIHLFDGNGNATLTVRSTGSDLAGQSLAQALARSDTLKTVSVYDARNQLTDTFEPTMEAARQLAAIAANSTGQAVFVTNNAAISIGPTGSLPASGTTVGNIINDGSLTIFKSYYTSYLHTMADISEYFYPDYFRYDQLHEIPKFNELGNGTVRLEYKYIIRGVETIGSFYINPEQTLQEFYQNTRWSNGFGGIYLYIRFFKQLGGQGEFQTTSWIPMLANGPFYKYYYNDPRYPYDLNYFSIELPKLLILQGQPPTTSKLVLAYRPAGTSGAYKLVEVPQLKNSAGAAMAGWFGLDWSAAGLSGGKYDIQYLALDSNGAVLNKQSGNLDLSNPAAPVVTQNNGALGGIGGAGRGLLTTDGNLHFLEQGNATQLTVKYRVKGSGSAWNTLTLNNASPLGTATPGWFSLAYASYFAAGTAYELDITASKGDTVVNHATAEFSRDTSGNPSLSAFTAVTQQPSLVHLTQRNDTQYVEVSYRPLGSTGAYTTQRLSPTAAGSGLFDWDAAALVPVASNNYDYEVVIRAYSAGDLLNNQTTATLRLGPNAAVLSATNQTPPLILRLTPPQAEAVSLKLSYRRRGSNDAYTSLGTTRAGSEFRAELTGLALPASGTADYEYIYDVYDANGALLGRSDGTFTLQPEGGSSTRLDWVIQDVANVSSRIHKSQTSNAFGEVIQETDGLGRITEFTYNTQGQLIRKAAPETDITLANGFVTRGRPTTRYVYDLTGRLIATIDPNGNISTQVWLNGDQGSRIVLERHADGGLVSHAYDIFGDKRIDTDALGNRTEMAYDKLGHLIEVKHPLRAAGTPGNSGTAPVQAVDRYTYDGAGNRITHTNALGDTEKIDYDSLGRVTRTTDVLGFSISYRYVYRNDILGLSGLQSGGWEKTTTNAVGRTLIDRSDLFGRTTWHQDLGGRQFTYAYNGAGWLVNQSGSNGQSIQTEYYANGFIKSIWDKATGAYTAYAYDAAGNRTFEGYVTLKNPADLNGGVRDYHQYATLEYDELNRLKRVFDPKADIQYEYDGAGNRRRVVSSYHDGVNGSRQTQEYWYAYDAMNRFTVTMGQLSGGQRAGSADDHSVSIVKGATGVEVAYDLGGNRRQARNGADGTVESYSYSADGYLEEVRIDGVLRSRRTQDLLGRVTDYREWNAAGSQSYSRITTYDKAGRILAQSGSDGSTTNYYYTDANDNSATATQGGAGELAKSVNTNSGTTVSSYFTYDYWDSAKEKAVTAQAYNPVLQGNNAYWRPGYSGHTYDVNGHLQTAVDAGLDGAQGTADDRVFRYVSDAQGLVVLRDETAAGMVNRKQQYYYANGVRVGDVGNDGPSRTDYVKAMAGRSVDHKSYKNWQPIASADFDQNYEPVSPSYPAMVPGSYTVRSGDTLPAIAQTLWGDSSLWYLLADINGLNGNETLAAGQVLTVPNKVSNIHNNSGTFRAYNPGEVMGDTQPTIPTAPPPPQPKGKGGCGGASILIAVVAVVATIATAGTAAIALEAATAAGTTAASMGVMGAGVAALGGSLGAAGLGAALIGGAVGSIAGQLTGMALGVQDKFSWGAVAAGALSAGAMAGMTDWVSSLGIKNPIANAMVNAGARNVVGQGINILTGQQKGFSWSSVAASAISAPITQAVSGAVFGSEAGKAFAQNNPLGAGLLQSGIGALTSAATRVALVGGKLSWEAVAADALSSATRDYLTGNVIGNSVTENTTTAGVTNAQDWALANGYRPLTSEAAEASMRESTPPTDLEKLKYRVGELNSAADAFADKYASEKGLQLSAADREIVKNSFRAEKGSAYLGDLAGYEKGLAFTDSVAVARLAQENQWEPNASSDPIVRMAFSSGVTVGDVVRVSNGPEGLGVGNGSWGIDSQSYVQAPGVLDTVNQGMSGAVDNAQDYYVTRGAEDLRQGNTLGYLANGVGYTLSAFAPRSVQEIAIGAVAGPIIGKGLQVAMPTIVRAAPILGRDVGSLFGRSGVANNILRSPSELMGVEPASAELLAAVGNKRSLVIAKPGSDELRMLDYFGAEASVGGVNNSSIILRENPSKAAVLEEFLHGTQARLGIIDRLGTSGLGSAETHVKDFMIRHQNMLGLGTDDVRILQILRDKGL